MGCVLQCKWGSIRNGLFLVYLRSCVRVCAYVYACASVRACVCVCACVRACVCVCVACIAETLADIVMATAHGLSAGVRIRAVC